MSISSSSTANHPLICCIATLYTLLFIYSPLSLNISLSPLLTLTSLLLLSLLRFGSVQQQQQTQFAYQPESPENVESSENDATVLIFSQNSDSLGQLQEWVIESGPGCDRVEPGRGLGSSTFVEWDVSAPLEVIYEAYEGEEEENREDGEDLNRLSFDPTRFGKYPSLSMYYPETDSDSSEDDSGGIPLIRDRESPESVCFKWEEEDREELIEIALDGVIEKKNLGSSPVPEPGSGSGFHVEEENLIEIDISPEKMVSL